MADDPTSFVPSFPRSFFLKGIDHGYLPLLSTDNPLGSRRRFRPSG